MDAAVLTVSDPWEFGSLHGVGPFPVRVLRLTPKAAVIQLLQPLTFKNVYCEFFIARPRHVGDSMESIRFGESVFCGLAGVSAEEAAAEDLQAVGWTGSRVGLIGTLEKSPDLK